MINRGFDYTLVITIVDPFLMAIVIGVVLS